MEALKQLLQPESNLTMDTEIDRKSNTRTSRLRKPSVKMLSNSSLLLDSNSPSPEPSKKKRRTKRQRARASKSSSASPKSLVSVGNVGNVGNTQSAIGSRFISRKTIKKTIKTKFSPENKKKTKTLKRTSVSKIKREHVKRREKGTQKKRKEKRSGILKLLRFKEPDEEEKAVIDKPISPPKPIIIPEGTKVHPQRKIKPTEQIEEQAQLAIVEPGIRYVEVFTTDFQEKFNKTFKPNTEKIRKFGLSPKTYADQCLDKLSDPSKKAAFDVLYKKYSLLIDYVDMVHDITMCIDYIAKIGLESELNKEVKELINQLCGDSFRKIRIKASHQLQRDYLMSYINDLKRLGFVLPGLQDPFIVTVENVDTTLSDIECCARESGRYLRNFLEKATSNKRITDVIHNALGAIDGCLGECDASTEVNWSHSVAGVINLNIKTKNNNSTITVSVLGDAFVFNVRGEIKLDDVVDLLPPGDNLPKRRESRNVENSITPPGNASHKNPKYLMAVISLKTICDKRILQRIQTDCDGVTLPKINAITTTDGYVWAGTLLAYLGNQINYCPSVLLTRETGYERFDFEKSSNLVDDLARRYTFYEDYLKYFDKRQSNNETASGETTKAFDFTDHYIKARVNELHNDEFISLWDFMRTLAIANQGSGWKSKKHDLKVKVDAVFDAESETPINKDKLINAILNIPTTVPSLVEFFGELEDQEDLYGSYDYEPDLGSLKGAFISRKDATPDTDATEFNRYFNNDLSVWPRVTCDPPQSKHQKCISEFMKKYKLKFKKTSLFPDFFPKTHKTNNFKIWNADDLMSSQIKDYVSNHTALYYLRIEYSGEEEAKIFNDFTAAITGVNNEVLPSYVDSISGNQVLFIPSSAEFLINIAVNLNKLAPSRGIDPKLFINEIAEKVFYIMSGWVNLIEERHLSAFKEFFRKSVSEQTEETRFAANWKAAGLPSPSS